VLGSLRKTLRARLQAIVLTRMRGVIEERASEAVAHVAGQVRGTHFHVRNGRVDFALYEERERLIDSFEREWTRGSKDIERWDPQVQKLMDRVGNEGVPVYDQAAAVIICGMLKLEYVCRAACLYPDDRRMQELAFQTLTQTMAAADHIFSGRTTLLPGEQSPALVLLSSLPYAGKVFDRQSELDASAEAATSDADMQASGSAQVHGARDRAGALFAHLRMGALGLGITIGYFVFAAVVFWGFLGLGITALLQLCFAGLREMPLFAASGVTVAPVLLTLSLLRAIFKQPEKTQVARVVNYIAKLYPPREDATDLQRRWYLGSLPTAVKVALTGVYSASLVIMIGFAAAVTVGYGDLYSPADLFVVKAGDDSARSIVQNFLFWLNVPFEFLLLEAPSTYGVRITELQANGSAYGFLTLILLFRVLLVSAVINLVYLVIMTKFDPDAEITYEQAVGLSA
jgi:hypothetical protein